MIVSRQYSRTVHAQLVAFRDGLSAADREDACKKYATIARRFPMLVRTAGLAQALAFIESRKDSDINRDYLRHIMECIGYDETIQGFDETDHAQQLQCYMLLTRKALKAAIWYQRLVVSVLGVAEEQVER